LLSRRYCWCKLIDIGPVEELLLPGCDLDGWRTRLEGVRQALSARGIVFAMARVKTDLKDQLQASGFLEKLGDEHVFPTLPTAVAGYRAWYEAQHGRPIVRPINPPPPPAP